MRLRIYLSHSKDDFDAAMQVQSLFQNQGVEVCLIQENAYANENWRKFIGENIANRPTFILLWSIHAAKSHYVEFEWNTALALDKKIFIVALDATPLPTSLLTNENFKYDSLSILIDEIKRTIKKAGQHEASPPEKILDESNNIQGKTAEEVVSKATLIFRQQGWEVTGNIYQGENITIQDGKSDPPPPKKWYEMWQIYLGLVAAILSILMLIPDLHKKWNELFGTEEVVESVSFKGMIVNEDNQAVPGATIKLDKIPGDSAVTTSDGGFIFENVPGKVGDQVRIYVSASGYYPRNEYSALPGPARLQMKKEAQQEK